jgi:Leucine-rich repeat (LRR) protein
VLVLQFDEVNSRGTGGSTFTFGQEDVEDPMTTRVVFVVVALLGFGLLCAGKEDQADWQKAVEVLQKRGGKFTQESPEKPPTALDLARARDLKDSDLVQLKALPSLKKLTFYDNDVVTDEGLANLKGLTNLTELTLTHIQVSGKGLAHLEGLSELESLHLGNTPVTDDDLAHLKAFKKLKVLHLYNTKITGTGLKNLSELSRLEFLHLSKNDALTDDGIKQLPAMAGLRHLYLEHTGITDKSVEFLKQMKGLEFLDLTETKLTDKGLKDLQDSLPKVQIRN